MFKEVKRKHVANKPKPKPSPAQVMMNRYKMMQERALEAENEAKRKVKEKVREISAKNKEKAATTVCTMLDIKDLITLLVLDSSLHTVPYLCNRY